MFTPSHYSSRSSIVLIFIDSFYLMQELGATRDEVIIKRDSFITWKRLWGGYSEKGDIDKERKNKNIRYGLFAKLNDYKTCPVTYITLRKPRCDGVYVIELKKRHIFERKKRVQFSIIKINENFEWTWRKSIKHLCSWSAVLLSEHDHGSSFYSFTFAFSGPAASFFRINTVGKETCKFVTKIYRIDAVQNKYNSIYFLILSGDAFANSSFVADVNGKLTTPNSFLPTWSQFAVCDCVKFLILLSHSFSTTFLLISFISLFSILVGTYVPTCSVNFGMSTLDNADINQYREYWLDLSVRR